LVKAIGSRCTALAPHQLLSSAAHARSAEVGERRRELVGGDEQELEQRCGHLHIPAPDSI
jgi:hypothetical protein